MGLFEEPCLHR
nr:unnamed protein product [Callosobruchus chinensis]